jgi:hypothetical protein
MYSFYLICNSCNASVPTPTFFIVIPARSKQVRCRVSQYVVVQPVSLKKVFAYDFVLLRPAHA